MVEKPAIPVPESEEPWTAVKELELPDTPTPVDDIPATPEPEPDVPRMAVPVKVVVVRPSMSAMLSGVPDWGFRMEPFGLIRKVSVAPFRMERPLKVGVTLPFGGFDGGAARVVEIARMVRVAKVGRRVWVSLFENMG